VEGCSLVLRAVKVRLQVLGAGGGDATGAAHIHQARANCSGRRLGRRGARFAAAVGAALAVRVQPRLPPPKENKLQNEEQPEGVRCTTRCCSQLVLMSGYSLKQGGRKACRVAQAAIVLRNTSRLASLATKTDAFGLRTLRCCTAIMRSLRWFRKQRTH